MKISLSKADRLNLLSAHKLSSSRKHADRIKAVLLADDGMSNLNIARVLFITEESVARHVRDYHSELKLENKSGGSESKLNDEQSLALAEHISNYIYQDSKEIISYVLARYGVKYSKSGMINWLHENSFSYKYPSETPGKADPIKQEEFIQKYESLKESLSIEDVIIFGDGVHPTMQTKTACGWIKTGVDKTIKTTASRSRLNLLGGINLADMSFTYTAHQTINSESVCIFLEKLKSHYPGKTINLILDRGPYNTSLETVKRADELGIILHHLPPYSPNLNPIERVWKFMNEKVRNNVYFKSAKDFKRSVLGFFEYKWLEYIDELKSRVTDHFERIKPSF